MGMRPGMGLGIYPRGRVDPVLAGWAARSQLFLRDGAATNLRNTTAWCPYTSTLKAATGPTAVPVTEANTCIVRVTRGGLTLPFALVQGPRTNLAPASSDFTGYTLGGATRDADIVTSPVGTLADRINFSATSVAEITRDYTYTAAAHTISAYVRTESGTKTFRLKLWDGTTDWFSPDFTATTTWQRFSFTQTVAAGSGNFAVRNNAGGTAGSILCDGIQLEAAGFPSGYIPTAGAAATRDGDDLRWTMGVSADTTAGGLTAIVIPHQFNSWSQAASGNTAGIVNLAREGTANPNFDVFSMNANSDLLRRGTNGSPNTLANFSNAVASGVSAVYELDYGALLRSYVNGALANSIAKANPYAAFNTISIGGGIALPTQLFSPNSLIAFAYTPNGNTPAERDALARYFAGAQIPAAA